MADKKMTIKDMVEKEGLQEETKPKKKRKRSPAKKKPAVKKETKKEKAERELNEITQAAEDYVKEEKSDLPPITLPTRGYFMKGDHGLNVEHLQRALNMLVDANLPIDGVVDPDTLAAVLKFEEKYGGFPNGMFGSTELDLYNKMRG